MAQTHHYLFDTATQYNDSTGSSNLTATGSASIDASGKINQCLEMIGYNANGAAYYSTNILPTSGSFTIAFWFYTESYDYSNPIMHVGPLLSTGLFMNWFGKFDEFELNDNSAGSFYVGGFQKFLWQHVIIIWDGSSWSIYRNNSLLTNSGSTFTPGANVYSASSSFVIDYGSTGYTNKIDDLRIYNSAIDATERAFIYNSGSGTQADSGGGGGGTPVSLSVGTNILKGYSTKPVFPQPIINVLNSGGTVEGSATNTVYASVVSGTATINGSASVVATSGVATFSGLLLTGFGTVGLGFTASGLSGTFSQLFNITNANPVMPIRSETAGTVPASGNLQIGELAINLADQKGYVKKSDGTIVTVFQAGGSITSGQITSGYIGNNAVVSGSIASGQVGQFQLADNSVYSGAIASGQVGQFHLSSGSVTSGAIASGQVGLNHFALEVVDIFPKNNNFRLSVTSGVPITSAVTSGNTSIFLVPYNGDTISLYDGSNWNNVSASGTAVSLSLAGLLSGRIYDVYAYQNGAVPALEQSTVWTNATTRADAIRYVNGVPLKSGTLTRRVVGTMIMTSTGGVHDNLVWRGLWNWDNRITRPLYISDTTTHTYSTTVARIWNNASGNQTRFVCGLAGLGVVTSIFAGFARTAGTGFPTVRISTNAGADQLAAILTSSATTDYRPSQTVYVNTIAGLNYMYPVEYSTASGTGSFAEYRMSTTIEG